MSTFIEQTDYLPQIRQYNLEDLIDDDSTILDEAEETAIQIVKDHLYQFYDVDDIFAQTGTARHRTVLQWCINIVLYLTFQRVADVMQPDSVTRNYNDTMAWLRRIAGGEQGIQGLPEITDPEGNPTTVFQWGSEKRRTY